MAQDMDALLQLETHFPSDRLSKRSFRHLLVNGNTDVLVFETQNKIAGNVVVLYRRNTRHARLYSLIVDPQYQQQGIARMLVQSAEDAARKKGCNFVGLELRPDNHGALRLYQSLGYILNKQKEAYYEDHSDALCMRKSIAAQP